MLRSVTVSLLVILFVSGTLFAQAEKPVKVSVCELKNNPDAYNHKLIQVEGTVSHEFEDFSLKDTACPDFKNTTWLMYGGDAPDDVTYCCNGTGNKGHVNVDGIEIALTNDEVLNRFRRLLNSYRIDKKAKVHYLQTDPTFSVTATLVGQFFAGKPSDIQGMGRGFGHMGCCTLLVIQQVVSIDKVISNLKPGEVSCYTEGWHENSNDDLLKAKQSEISKSAERWRNNDPQKVAAEALTAYLHDSNITLKPEGCRTKHLTYSDKKDDQFSTSCFWTSGSSDSYTVEVMKFYFLKNPSNKWKDIAWMPYEITHYHYSDSPASE